MQPVAPVHVPFPISWADEERDLTAWLGNDLQDDAFDTLYSLSEKMEYVMNYSRNMESVAAESGMGMKVSADELRKLHEDWLKLQTSDHFYYMCTKWFADGDVHKYFNPYGTPYDAYINFMNVLSDFMLRLSQHTFLSSALETALVAEEPKAETKKVVKLTVGKKTTAKKSAAKKTTEKKAATKKTTVKKTGEVKVSGTKISVKKTSTKKKAKPEAEK